MEYTSRSYGTTLNTQKGGYFRIFLSDKTGTLQIPLNLEGAERLRDELNIYLEEAQKILDEISLKGSL